MGELPVPDDALFGASTQRAVVNFPISGRPLPEAFIRALGLVKFACATANEELGLLASNKSQLIRDAALEVAAGKWSAHFPLDVFQTGSGTSANMNANEVIANRASQMAGEPLGSRRPVHPNDDVNLSQSSNDIIPTTLHLSVAVALHTQLAPALGRLVHLLEEKARSFADVVKIGRTHLMDATPLTLGQEFSGYATQARKSAERVRRAITVLGELAVGGTAVGTGLNCDPQFAPRVCEILSAETGLAFREARNHFEAQAARDDCAEVAGVLATIAASLTKIANDIRLLGSGPRAGLGEIRLPATQPGSSIMPGKVNPVMCEMLVQVCLHVHGQCQAAILCAREGHCELNTTLPLLALTLHDSIHCLANGVTTFADRCVQGIEADRVRCEELVTRSLMLVTALNPLIGYDAAAAVAKEALETGRTLREVALARKILDAATLDRVLDPAGMTQPNAAAPGLGGG